MPPTSPKLGHGQGRSHVREPREEQRHGASAFPSFLLVLLALMGLPAWDWAPAPGTILSLVFIKS